MFGEYFVFIKLKSTSSSMMLVDPKTRWPNAADIPSNMEAILATFYQGLNYQSKENSN